MSDELISQLISGGTGVMIAAALFGIVWKSPELMRSIQGILAQMLETSEAAADRLILSNTTLMSSLQESQNLVKDSIERLRLLDIRVTGMVELGKIKDTQIERQLKKIATETQKVDELAKSKIDLETRVVDLEKMRDLLNKRITFLETELKIAYEAGNTEASVGLAGDLAANKDELDEVQKKMDAAE